MGTVSGKTDWLGCQGVAWQTCDGRNGVRFCGAWRARLGRLGLAGRRFASIGVAGTVRASFRTVGFGRDLAVRATFGMGGADGKGWAGLERLGEAGTGDDRQSEARQGWRGKAAQNLAWKRWSGAEGEGVEGRGEARPGRLGAVLVWPGRQGLAGRGCERKGMAGMVRPCEARPGSAGPGRPGSIRRGRVRIGWAGEAWRGRVGAARIGKAGNEMREEIQ